MSAVLTWLAHGTAVVALAALAMRLPLRLAAATRYDLWWLVMSVVLVLPSVHALWPVLVVPFTHAAAGSAPAVAVAGEAGTPDGLGLVVPAAWRAAGPWLAGLILAATSWRLWRLERSFASLRRLRARCRPLPAGFEARLPLWLRAQGRGRRAPLLLCADLDAPAVIGAGAPVIALPPWALDLAPDALDLLVLHEQAHVDRRDERDLLVQATVQALFIWHPAVWWVARRLNGERERACDDRVVAATRRPADYARSIVSAVEQRALRSGRLPLETTRGGLNLAPGLGRAGRALGQRLDRILSGRAGHEPPFGGAIRAAAVLVLAGAVVTSAASWPRVRVQDATWASMPTSAMTFALPPSPRTTPSSGAFVVAAQPAVPSSPRRDTARPDAADPPVRSKVERDPVQSPTGEALATSASAVLVSGETPTQEPALDAAPAAVETMPLAVATVLEARSLEGSSIAPRPGPPPAWWLRDASHDHVPSLPAPSAEGPWEKTADAGLSIGRGTAAAGTSIGRGSAAAGESIGRGTAAAGVKTAGLFTRMGRAIASSF